MRGIDLAAEAVIAEIKRMAKPVGEGSGDFGFNARTGSYGPLIADGVIDPAKVTITALRNAASIAGLLLGLGAAGTDQG